MLRCQGCFSRAAQNQRYGAVLLPPYPFGIPGLEDESFAWRGSLPVFQAACPAALPALKCSWTAW